MPDVRCACAKRVSARQALGHSGTSSALLRHPPPSQIASGHQSTRSGSPHPGRLPSRVGARASQPSSALALPARRTAALSRFPVHPALRPVGRSSTPYDSRVPSSRRRSPSTRERRGSRNAQLRRSCRPATHVARATKRRHHAEVFRGAGTLNVVLASRPFLTGAPNPGMQRTRYARR
jgi:hypothetical protein